MLRLRICGRPDSKRNSRWLITEPAERTQGCIYLDLWSIFMDESVFASDIALAAFYTSVLGSWGFSEIRFRFQIKALSLSGIVLALHYCRLFTTVQLLKYSHGWILSWKSIYFTLSYGYPKNIRIYFPRIMGNINLYTCFVPWLWYTAGKYFQDCR